MAYVFPPVPTAGLRYPANPGVIGSAQYFWDTVYGVWNTVDSNMKTGNQDAYNGYRWPTTPGNAFDQLTSDGAGNLTWQPPSEPEFRAFDDIAGLFDDTIFNFPLTINGVPYTPEPVTDIIVFLGGVFQQPGDAYTIITPSFGIPPQISFTEPPKFGTSFYAATSRDQTQPE
jgi:hypothetical protein